MTNRRVWDRLRRSHARANEPKIEAVLELIIESCVRMKEAEAGAELERQP